MQFSLRSIQTDSVVIFHFGLEGWERASKETNSRIMVRSEMACVNYVIPSNGSFKFVNESSLEEKVKEMLATGPFNDTSTQKHFDWSSTSIDHNGPFSYETKQQQTSSFSDEKIGPFPRFDPFGPPMTGMPHVSDDFRPHHFSSPSSRKYSSDFFNEFAIHGEPNHDILIPPRENFDDFIEGPMNRIQFMAEK